MFGAMSAFRIAGTVLLIIGAFFACNLMGFAAGNDLRPGYNEQFVPMVDPGGRDPSRDLTYSQANKNNSEANVNNANAVKSLAQSTAIIRQSEYNDPLYVPREITEMEGNAFNRGMLFVVGAIFVFVIGFIIKGMMSGGQSGGNGDGSLSRR